jgi:Na+-translocating ferredoxin:NAD+ oxidoreductase RnfD subunit
MNALVRTARTPKAWLAAFFVLELAAAASATGWRLVLPHVLVAVLGAVAVDLVGARLVGRGWHWPTSALLSGLIVAFVLGPETAPMVTAMVAGLSSAYKYLIRTNRSHVFNPAGLALLVAIPVFGTGQSWWGALADMPWAWTLLLVAGGAVIAERVNKLPIVLAFLGTYFALFTVAGLADPARAAEMFRPPFLESALFMAFFMLTDPPTSPARPFDQAWIGYLAGITACMAQLLGAGQAYLLLGLMAANVALAGQRWWQEVRLRRGSGRAADAAGVW